MHVIPGGPHNAYFEMPERWNAVAQAFLEEVVAAKAG